MSEAHIRPLFLELDLHSEQGRALQRSVSDRYGTKIVDAAQLAGRMFMLRSPWAPGLRFVGAETTTRVLSEDGQTLTPISLSGSGEALEEAFVSCVGEGVDRLAQMECPGDVVAVASMREVADRLWPAAVAPIEQAVADLSLPRETSLAWVAGKLLDPSSRFHSAREILLPADWCLRRAVDGRRLPPRAALSVGVAAGPTFEWAASRAILELIERDAVSLWWTGGRRGKAIPLDQPCMTNIVELAVGLRQQTNDRVLWLLDITTDIGIPVVAALSCGRDGRRLAYGLASRLSIEEAMRAAILELCQTELAILLAAIKRSEVGEDMLLPTDRAHLDRDLSIDANQCALLHPAGIQSAHGGTNTAPPLARIARALHRLGIEVALVELTRPEFDVPVVRAVSPALQPMPSSLVTDRLRHTLAECGGGRRYTGGIPLIV